MMRTSGFVFLALTGCNSVLGLDERTFDPCVDYCNAIETTCTQENAQFQDEASCLGTCKLLEQGDSDQPTGNTVACRVAALESAKTDPALFCPAAGPGGFDRESKQVCGDRCTTYCQFMETVCAERSDIADLDLESCLTLCSGVTDNPAYTPTNGDIKDHDDSIQCRLWHLSVATEFPDPHCAHADGRTKCDGIFPSTTSSTSGGM